MRKGRPELRLEIAGLGTVDPFRLRLVEPSRPSEPIELEDPDQPGKRTTLEVAGLCLAGAGQALLTLSIRWMDRAEPALDPAPLPAGGEVRLVLKRREARLLEALLRRHVRRLRQAPPWMEELRRSFVQIDEFLRWEE